MKQNRGTEPRDKVIQLRLSSLFFQQLKKLSIDKNQTMSEIIRDAVTEKYFLEKNNSR
jgi:predicted DNA-binding protein